MEPRPVEPVVLSAPAKVNLYLGVGRLRDDGYHDVTTVLAALDLADRVSVTPAASLGLTCEPPLDIPAEENLAYRAALMLAETAGRRPDTSIGLEKRIPSGAGLGGGSSDAAAVLFALGRRWGLDPLASPVTDVARALGADVAFFLAGGVALFDGKGDRLVRRLGFVRLHLVLFRPPEPVPTGLAYAAFDRMLSPEPPGPDAVIEALESKDPAAVGAALFNNLTEASTGLVGSLAEALRWVRRREGVLGAAMAGSGSAVFGVCVSAARARELAEEARERGWWSAATETVSCGVGPERQGGDA